MSTTADDPVARIAAAMDAAMTDPNGAIPAPLKPPAAWFRDLPETFVAPPEGPLVQIDLETGRVAALVAPYGECILDGRSGCWTPGMSKTNYEYAHVGAIVTAEGETIRTANVGGGINHFDTSLATAASLAADHYANSATRRMIGRYVDVPDVGIMFLGSMYPGSTYMHAFEAMTSALSGDWRWIESLRDHEMVGAQLVNNPGFRPNPLRNRPMVAAVSFKSTGAKVASAAGCSDAATIISEWEPINTPSTPFVGRFATLEAVTASLMLDAVEDRPMLPSNPVDIMDLDDDGDEGEDWLDELADLTDDECRHCRGGGCKKCEWLGYTGPDDQAMVAALRSNEALVAKLMRRPDKARDGDGDGFVYDSTPRQRPVIPGFDIIGENIDIDTLKRAAAGDSAARKKVRDRAAENYTKAAKAGTPPKVQDLAQATLGDRPKDRPGQQAWDTMSRDVASVHSIRARTTPTNDDPDRIPGGRNPIEGRRPRSPAETAVDRASKAKARGVGGRVTKAEARRSRGGKDVPSVPEDITPVPEVRREGANPAPKSAVPFTMSANALATIKSLRDTEDSPETLAMLVDRLDDGKYRMEFVERDSLGPDIAVTEFDGLTVALPREDADAMRGKRLEAPSWGGGVAFVEPDDPSSEGGWDDRPRPKKAQFKLPAEGRFESWDDDRLLARAEVLNDYIATGGRGQQRPTGVSARTEFERRAIERLAITKELESRGLDVPEPPDDGDPDFPEAPAADAPFTTAEPDGEAAGPISDLVEGIRRFADPEFPGAMPDTTGRNSRSTDVRPVGEGGTPVDSISGPVSERPELPNVVDRGPATPGVSNVDRTARNPGAPVALTPDEVRQARGIPEDTVPPPVDDRPSINPEMRQAGEDWRDERNLLRPGVGPVYLSDGDPGSSGGTGRDPAKVEWDPDPETGGKWVRSSPVGIPDPAEVGRQRVALEARLASIPGYDRPEERAAALDEILRGVGKQFPLLSTKAIHDGRGDNGKEWSPERRAIHNQILTEIEERLEAAGVPKDRVALFTGGLPGSGKSFALQPGQKAEALKAVVWELDSPNPPEVPDGFTLYVAVNSDYMKERMAELGLNTGIEGLKPMEEASFMHSESSYLGERLEDRLADLGFNIAFDGTMGDEAKVRKKLDQIEEKGYAKPKLVFADITVEESAASAAARYRRKADSVMGGRFVPSDVAEGNVSRMGNFSMNRDTANFLVNEGRFDAAIVIDNRGVSNSQAKTAFDLDPDFPVPAFKAEELGLRVSTTPDPKDGSFAVLDPEHSGLRVEAFAEVEGVAEGGRWTQYDGVDLDELGPQGYPPRSVERVRRMPGVKGGDGTKDNPFDLDDVNTAAILLAEGEYVVRLDQPDEIATLMDRLKELVDEAKAAGRAAPTYDLCRVSVPGTNLFCADNKGYERIQMPQLGTNAPEPGSVADRLLAQQQVEAFRAGAKIPDEVDLAPLFMEHMRSLGYKIEVVQTPARELRASQSELNGVKVSGMVDWKETAQAAAPVIADLNARLDAGDISIDDYIAEARAAGAKVPNGVPNADAIDAIRPQAVWTPRRIITTSDNYIVDGHHGWASDVAIDYGTNEEVLVESFQIARADGSDDGVIVEVLEAAKEWATAMGSPPQSASGVGADGLTDAQREYQRRRKVAGWGGMGFFESDLVANPVAPGEIEGILDGGGAPAGGGAPVATV